MTTSEDHRRAGDRHRLRRRDHRLPPPRPAVARVHAGARPGDGRTRSTRLSKLGSSTTRISDFTVGDGRACWRQLCRRWRVVYSRPCARARSSLRPPRAARPPDVASQVSRDRWTVVRPDRGGPAVDSRSGRMCRRGRPVRAAFAHDGRTERPCPRRVDASKCTNAPGRWRLPVRRESAR